MLNRYKSFIEKPVLPPAPRNWPVASAKKGGDEWEE